MTASESLYRRHRFPAEIISHCVWLYFRFTLSFRDVEELMSSRGVSLTYETVRAAQNTRHADYTVLLVPATVGTLTKYF